MTGAVAGSGDLAQLRASLGKLVSVDICGTTGTRPCAIFDVNEVDAVINAGDLTWFRTNLNGHLPGPKCPLCPLTCAAGTAGTCGPIP